MAHPVDDRAALGARLAAARNDVGYSLEGAAAELTRRGYTIGKAAVGAWEKGRNVPDALWLARLADLYGTTLDVLAGEDSSAWPFTLELLAEVGSLTTDGLVKLEGVMRAHLGMAPISAQSLHDLPTQAVTDPSVTPNVHVPAGQKPSRVSLNQIKLGAQGEREVEVGKDGRVQRPRRGRNA